MADSISSTPRNPYLGMLADLLTSGRAFANRAKLPDALPLIGGSGVGDMLLGKSPDEVNELSYGNAPMQVVGGGTGSFVPQTKLARGQQLADALMTLGPLAKTASAAPGAMRAAMDDVLRHSTMASGQRGMIAWHGSPHRFSKFDMSKIGTGEGAQAYGHGLYMAQNKAVADEYAGKLSRPVVSFPTGVDSASVAGLSPEAAAVVKRMQDIAETTQYGSKSEQAGKVFFSAPESVQKELSGNAPRWNAFDILDTGSLYKADIPDEAVARFLDWDKPLSQQAPAVKKAFEPYYSKVREAYETPANPGLGDLSAPFEPTGRDLLSMMRDRTADDSLQSFMSNGLGPDSSAYLKSKGVPGIRYLDGGSRSAGQGSSNFVLFDDQLPRILEINGAPTGLQPWKPGEWK